MRELKSLRSSLPLHPDAAVFFRHDESMYLSIYLSTYLPIYLSSYWVNLDEPKLAGLRHHRLPAAGDVYREIYIEREGLTPQVMYIDRYRVNPNPPNPNPAGDVYR